MPSVQIEWFSRFLRGTPRILGNVVPDLPEIAMNGDSVQMTIWVESPMIEASHVTDVLVVADGNSSGGGVTFHFSPASGVAEVSTHIRLRSTQKVTAVAKMNDGSFCMRRKKVRVAIEACGC
jgi:sulfur-oxidizing protein SoxY